MKTHRLALALVLSVAALASHAGAAAPEFISQPSSLSVASGDPAVLACDAVGSPTPTLQWSRNGIAIAGANTRRLVVSSAGPEHAGNYTCTATSSAGTTTSAVAVLSVLDAADPGRLANLSIRTNAGMGAETLITGFAVGGTGATGSKPLLLRGMGPSLAQFGVPLVLSDPLLTVYSGADATAMNDDWAGNAQIRNVSANVGAFAFAGDGAKDCAIFAPATAIGSHTAQISCPGGSSGMVLAEIYDATPQLSFTATTPRLINVSARARVGTSSDILIAGFVIGGSTAKTLLIRAVGPTLSSFGVTGVLLDPELEVYAGARRLSSNDDWGNDADVAYAATLVGGFPLGNASKDSAILITLPPGNYTAQVRGVGTATGVGLVELYEVPAAPSWPTVTAPAKFVLIPAGTFIMGDSKDEGYGDEIPIHSATLSSFYLQSTEVTYAQWKEIVDWNSSGSPGYDFPAGRRGSALGGSALPDTAANNAHPVTAVSWWDIVKWCNAKSRREGITPCYYIDAGFGTELKSGTPNMVYCNWSANGYRLPTDAEWEYAARGGLAGASYPWGDGITGSQANYASSGDPFEGTSPVGYYNGSQTPAGVDMKNGYGLYDMAGNVWENVWDWHGRFSSVAQTNPTGPALGTIRVNRGGSWYSSATSLRASFRNWSYPENRSSTVGFRLARNVVP